MFMFLQPCNHSRNRAAISSFYPAKIFQLLLFGSLEGGRIIEGPVELFAHTREYLWAIPLRMLTDDNQIMGDRLPVGS